ncbi:MAG: TIGR00270 family protein [Candidatus Diapherotrites archaeon]|nr:TIGR00270 family protein [Candidatus Diapherotrites archaeon]
MDCELCGNAGFLKDRLVGGARLKVCARCSKFGAEIPRAKFVKRFPNRQGPRPPSALKSLASDLGARVKSSRVVKGWAVDDLAQKVFEKKSVILRIEAGSLTPSETLVTKLERMLGISLKEVVSDSSDVVESKPRLGAITLADVIEIKRK